MRNFQGKEPKKKNFVVLGTDLLGFISEDIPCNVGKQHQLCASTHHSQAPHGKDEVMAATQQNVSIKCQSIHVTKEERGNKRSETQEMDIGFRDSLYYNCFALPRYIHTSNAEIYHA